VSCGPSGRAGQAHRTDAGGSRHGRLPAQPGEVGGGRGEPQARPREFFIFHV
jgi:hypothetical protein